MDYIQNLLKKVAERKSEIAKEQSNRQNIGFSNKLLINQGSKDESPSKKFGSKSPVEQSQSLNKIDFEFEFASKREFQWLPYNQVGQCQLQSAGPLHFLNKPSSLKLPANSEIKTNIVFERSLMYSQELGWNWHKIWKLPNLKVTTQVLTEKSGCIQIPFEIIAEIIGVKVVPLSFEQNCLQEVPLKGTTVVEIVDGEAEFTDLKFGTTSYNSNGAKFHLIVLICLKTSENHRASILNSFICPPIFVDSRKAARDSNEDKSKKLAHRFFDPFAPESLTKNFVKRNDKLNEEPIENNLQGLFQYFSAPNIRNKVKHPVFLAVKFSNCVKLYYNTKLEKPTVENDGQIENELVLSIQQAFIETYAKMKVKVEESSLSHTIDRKSYLLLVEEASNKDTFLLIKKIGDYLDPLQSDVMLINFNSAEVPSYFAALNPENLKNAYNEQYNKIRGLKRSQAPYKTQKIIEGDRVSNQNAGLESSRCDRGGYEVSPISEDKILESFDKVAEPSVLKKVRKDFSDVSSIDEERKSDCSRLSIEQRFAEMKMEDEDLPIRRVKTFTPTNSSQILQKLKQQASALVTIENQKARSQTAGLLDMPRGLKGVSQANNTKSYISNNSTDNSNNSIASIDLEISRSRSAKPLTKVLDPGILHYLTDSIENVTSDLRNQQKQPEIISQSNFLSTEQERAQLYYNQSLGSGQNNLQLLSNTLLTPIILNSNLEKNNHGINGNRYDAQSSQINRVFELNSQNLMPSANNTQLDLNLGKINVGSHPLVLAALQNINANLMFISQVMKNGSSADDILSRQQYLPLLGSDLGASMFMHTKDNRINLLDTNNTPKLFNSMLQMIPQPLFQQAIPPSNQQDTEKQGNASPSPSTTNQNNQP